jgi:hypothetical protein
MRSRFSVSAVSWVLLLVITAAVSDASAQARLDVFVTPIPNAPFSGTINVERSTVLRDGSIARFKTIRNIHRDSRGRIYNESRGLLPASSTDTPQVVSIHLYDPQTRVSTVLNPRLRTFWTSTVNRPPETVPPVFLNASPTGNSLPQNEFTREEDLGTQEIEGLVVHGIRETQTIPAESGGTAKEIVITDEYWYSADLRINMVIKHSDPRTGAVTMTVIRVTRSEPDPALLQIPEGYTPARGGQETGQ